MIVRMMAYILGLGNLEHFQEDCWAHFIGRVNSRVCRAQNSVLTLFDSFCYRTKPMISYGES